MASATEQTALILRDDYRDEETEMTVTVTVTPSPPSFLDLDNPNDSLMLSPKQQGSRNQQPTTKKQSWSLSRLFQIFQQNFSWIMGHTAFFVGTLCAVLAAKMNLQDAIAYNEDEDDDDDSDDYGYYFAGGNPLKVWNVAKALSVASTAFYLLDTSLMLIQTRQQQHRQHQNHFTVPALFGLGALFDLSTSLFEDEDSPWIGFCSEILSVHFFLFSAVSTMSRHFYDRNNDNDNDDYSNDYYSRSMKMTMTGDILFLLGALIDVVVSYSGDHPLVSYFEGRTEWICNASLALASSITWMLDSILYLVADILEVKGEEDDDDDNEFGSGQDNSSQQDMNGGGYERHDNFYGSVSKNDNGNEDHARADTSHNDASTEELSLTSSSVSSSHNTL